MPDNALRDFGVITHYSITLLYNLKDYNMKKMITLAAVATLFSAAIYAQDKTVVNPQPMPEPTVIALQDSAVIAPHLGNTIQLNDFRPSELRDVDARITVQLPAWAFITWTDGIWSVCDARWCVEGLHPNEQFDE